MVLEFAVRPNFKTHHHNFINQSLATLCGLCVSPVKQGLFFTSKSEAQPRDSTPQVARWKISLRHPPGMGRMRWE